MSTGIIVDTEPEIELEESAYLQNLAMDFEAVFFGAQAENWDLSTYLYCPESEQDEEEMREFEASDEDIAYMKLITRGEFHPTAEVLERVKNAIARMETVEEHFFDHGKGAFVMNLEELRDVLAAIGDEKVKVRLMRG